MTSNKVGNSTGGGSYVEHNGGGSYGKTENLNVEECVMINKKTWCSKHNCRVSKVTVTSKKWQWLDKKKCYGNVSSKVMKYLCRNRNSGHTVQSVPPKNVTESNSVNFNGENPEVGRGGSYVVRHVGTGRIERESKQTDGDVKSLTGRKRLNPFS